MKKFFTLFFTLFFTALNAQLPYTWTTGVNPGWISTGSGPNLTWRAGCAVVTTNCTGNYSNNQSTYYTSPTIDASCSNSLSITFSASGNAENGWDFLFIEYSLNNGTTWINPYGAGIGWTGNFGAGSTIPPVTVPSSSTFKFRFRFYSDNSFTYSGYKITDFDIVCIVSLPIELISFEAINVSCNNNKLTWVTASETNNDHFDIEKSNDAINFTVIGNLKSIGNSTVIRQYDFFDNSKNHEIVYYRLKQVDYDGSYTYSRIVSVNNQCDSSRKIVRIVNVIGQQVDENFPGVKIIYYSDGTFEKITK